MTEPEPSFYDRPAFAPGGRYDYRAFGLNIRSEIAIPELPAGAIGSSADPDVVVRLGDVPPIENPIEYLRHQIQFGSGWIAIDPMDQARFLIREGREIILSPRPGASENGARIFLLGSVFGAICHQRGLLPLHANAVELNGRAYVFCGESGAGKSTLAAYFQQQGFRLLCDDLCVVGFDAAGRPLAWPGVPRLKLWGDALSGLGKTAQGLVSIGWDLDKYHVPIESYAGDGAYPLANIYRIGYATEVRPAAITRLAGIEATNAIFANTFRRRFADLLGNSAQYLGQVRHLIEHCGVFSAVRSEGFENFDGEAQRLVQHMQQK